MTFRPNNQIGYYDYFGNKYVETEAERDRQREANPQYHLEPHSVPNRSDLTCPDCGGKRLHQLEKPLYETVRAQGSPTNKKERFAVESRVYCLDCGWSRQESISYVKKGETARVHPRAVWVEPSA